MAYSKGKSILVIGAGACGLTAVKACIEEGLDVVCYEKTGNFGGLWHYRDEELDGVASLMKSTVSNTSKEMSSFSDFPAPSHFPIYMPHSDVLAYLKAYAEHFDVLSRIKYNEEVIELKPSDDYHVNGQWVIKVKNTGEEDQNVREEVYDGVMVCSGCFSCPYSPSPTGLGTFSGQVLHSHSYKTFSGMEGKNVLVVGAGNSGMDIAVELANVCNKVYLSTRRGVWVFPRTEKNLKPLDVLLNRRSKAMSLSKTKERRAKSYAIDLKKLDMEPTHSIFSQHPTVNDDLQARLASGSLVLKRDVIEFEENGARFEDEKDTTIPLDVVIFATGYLIRFPFLSDDILKVGTANEVFLYKGVFPPQLAHPTLAIMGIIVPNGSSFLIGEMQARWFAAVVNGRSSLPSEKSMMKSIKSDIDKRRKTYLPSQRHAVERDILTYLDDISSKVGVAPSMASLFFKDTKLFWACFTGPLLGYQYRLRGPHSWMGARNAILTYKNRLYGREPNRET